MESNYVIVNGKKVRMRKLTNENYSKNFILLHGYSFNGRVWEDQGVANTIFKKGFNVYMPDYPGFGESEINEKYSIQRGVLEKSPEFINDLVKILDLFEYYILGSSMGGGMALMNEIKYPGSCKGMVLVSPAWVEKYKERFREIKIPVELIWGENDNAVNPSVGKEYTELIPNSTMTLIMKAGHAAYIDNNKEFLSVLLRILDNFIKAEL
ncbi:alpha/beta fold hydrolase [Caldiplasma sukawensis]